MFFILRDYHANLIDPFYQTINIIIEDARIDCYTSKLFAASCFRFLRNYFDDGKITFRSASKCTKFLITSAKR